MQIYPPASGSDTDLLVKNEIAVHTALQQLFLGTRIPGSERMIQLLGHLTRTSGEQVPFRGAIVLTFNPVVVNGLDFWWSCHSLLPAALNRWQL